METAKDTEQEALMQALGFTIADLESNRDALLTDHQREQLDSKRGSRLGVVIVSILFFTVDFYISVTQIRLITDLGSPILLGVVLLGVAFIAWGKYRQFTSDMDGGNVSYTAGKLRKMTLRNPAKSTDYELIVDGVRFRVRSTIYESFKNSGDPYAIYFAPHSKTLLSAEWLGKREVSG